jgi:hypothetical protein
MASPNQPAVAMDGTAGVKQRAKGLEPSTSSLGSSVPVVLNAGNPAFSDAGASGCTGGCTETDSRAEIIARAVELVASLNLSLLESVSVLRCLLRGGADGDALRTAHSAIGFHATAEVVSHALHHGAAEAGG